jgi:hypothetical protein
MNFIKMIEIWREQGWRVIIPLSEFQRLSPGVVRDDNTAKSPSERAGLVKKDYVFVFDGEDERWFTNKWRSF